MNAIIIVFVFLSVVLLFAGCTQQQAQNNSSQQQQASSQASDIQTPDGTDLVDFADLQNSLADPAFEDSGIDENSFS